MMMFIISIVAVAVVVAVAWLAFFCLLISNTNCAAYQRQITKSRSCSPLSHPSALALSLSPSHCVLCMHAGSVTHQLRSMHTSDVDSSESSALIN